MNTILIHSESVKRAGEKFPFQFKIPTNVERVRGILATVHLTIDPSAAQTDIEPGQRFGQLQLHIPEKRDYFFTEDVVFHGSKQAPLPAIKSVGISTNNSWWIQGNMQHFFRVTVPANVTVIEGFYEDVARQFSTYTLKLYFLCTKKQP